MDLEQEYYDLLYENRKLKNEIDILENELVLIKNDKKFMAITLTFVNKVNKLNKIINKIFIYNTKIIRSEKSKNKRLCIK